MTVAAMPPDPGLPSFAPPPQVVPEAPIAPPPPAPDVLEALARHVLERNLEMSVKVSAPTWREILFGAMRIKIAIPTASDNALKQIDAEPEVPPDDKPAEMAATLQAHLRSTRPRGLQPQSITGAAQLPPPRDAMISWQRRVFLTVCGPGVLRLLVAGGYLTPDDISIIEEAYPAGLDIERREAVEAAIAFGAAGMRNGHSTAIPPWQNSQFLTLMGDQTPPDFYHGLYEATAAPPGANPQGPSASAPKSNLVEQTRPSVNGEGST